VRYVWDPIKARTNATKHGVTFEEAVTVFGDRLGVIVDDDVHPERSFVIGASDRYRILYAVFIERDNDVTRIISARVASKRERRQYEEGS
jgi:uncharacterized protein